MVIRRLIHAISSALANWSGPKQMSEALVHVPAVSGTWRQWRDSNRRLGFEHTCLCGQERLYGNDEQLVTTMRSCTCGREFSLLLTLNALSADGRVAPSELAVRLDSLAIKPFVPQAQQSPYQVVGNEPVQLRWGGKQDAARDRAFETGDPADMGPGFIQGRNA